MKITLTIQRDKPTGKSTPGEMFVNGVWQCYTLEPDPLTPAISGHPSIPAGVYPVQLTMSPHMHYITPILIGVPGRTAIRIHIANFPKELEGCTAVGTEKGPDEVLHSKFAFQELMHILTSINTTSIVAEYKDAQAVNLAPAKE